MEALVFVQRVAGAIGHAVLRQHHRQILLGDGYRAMLGAMDDGYRCAPIALTAHTPVPQPPGDLFLAQSFDLQCVADRLDRFQIGHAAETVGVDGHAALLVAVPVLPAVVVVFQSINQYHFEDGDAVLLGEGEVPLVVRRYAHHGAVAVVHQDVIANPDLYFVTVEWVDHMQAGAHAFFFPHGQLGLRGAALLAFLNEGGQFRVVLRGVRGQWVFRRHRTKCHAHDGVGARGEDIHPAIVNQFAAASPDVMREGKTNAFGLADPVFLHQLDALGPAGQSGLDLLQQLIGVVCDLEVIPRNFALFHFGAGAPAFAVNHLFIGQHGLIDGVPIDDLGLAVGNAFFQHLQEQPLVPLVVTGIAGGNLA